MRDANQLALCAEMGWPAVVALEVALKRITSSTSHFSSQLLPYLRFERRDELVV
jgi:hypothetical protein